MFYFTERHTNLSAIGSLQLSSANLHKVLHIASVSGDISKVSKNAVALLVNKIILKLKILSVKFNFINKIEKKGAKIILAFKKYLYNITTFKKNFITIVFYKPMV